MKFAYDAFDAAGKPVNGSLEAGDAAEATEHLRRQGLFVAAMRINDIAQHSDDSARKFAWRGRCRLSKTKRGKCLAMFTRQLSVLTSSGTPLVQALMSLEKQANEPAWRAIVCSIRGKVEEGATLSQAMDDHPETFDPVCRSLIAAGESGGGFDQMLDRLSTMTRKQAHIRSAVTGAMVYPALLIVISVNVLATMLLFVLPRFTGLFTSLDVALPPSTKLLVDISALLRTYWWGALALIVIAVFGLRAWIKLPRGRRMVDTLAIKLPILGAITRSFLVARITRVLGVLITGKVPMLEALALARQTIRNVHFVELMSRTEHAVTQGSTISSVLEQTDLVSPSLVEAIRSGEQSGQMGSLLLNISDFLDEDNEVIVKSLTSILEPMILIAMGVVVGFIAISMFLPLFDLTSLANGAPGGG